MWNSWKTTKAKDEKEEAYTRVSLCYIVLFATGCCFGCAFDGQAKVARDNLLKLFMERTDITPDSKLLEVAVLLKDHPLFQAVTDRERGVSCAMSVKRSVKRSVRRKTMPVSIFLNGVPDIYRMCFARRSPRSRPRSAKSLSSSGSSIFPLDAPSLVLPGVTCRRQRDAFANLLTRIPGFNIDMSWRDANDAVQQMPEFRTNLDLKGIDGLESFTAFEDLMKAFENEIDESRRRVREIARTQHRKNRLAFVVCPAK